MCFLAHISIWHPNPHHLFSSSSRVCVHNNYPLLFYFSSSHTFTQKKHTAMAKSVLILALCVLLPVLISASRPMSRPFHLQGRVYCDTCRAGFETSATTYIPRAKVRVECRNRQQKLLYTMEGMTDATGTYNIPVNEDHGDETCDVVLVSSPLGNCNKADPGRDRARVVLTSYNGIVSDTRFANAMGFMKDQVMSGCTTLLQSLMEEDD